MRAVVGITVAGPKPVGLVHVPLKRGLNVIYGQNGVGKSRLLAAASELLHARRRRPTTNGSAFELCEAALVTTGGVHLHLPPAEVRAADPLEDLSFLPFSRIASMEDFMAAEAINATEVPEDRWNRMRDDMVRAILAGASWESPTVDEAIELIDDGRWFVAPSSSGVDVFAASRPDRTLRARWNGVRDAVSPAPPTSFTDGDEDLAEDNTRSKRRMPALPDGRMPDWVAVPVAHVRSLTHEEDDVPWWYEEAGAIGETLTSAEMAKRTRQAVKSKTLDLARQAEEGAQPISRQRLPLVAESGGASGTLLLAADLIEESANSQFQVFFDRAPSLSLHVRPPSEWFDADPVVWTASVDGSPQLPLSSLGTAHERYARFSIQRALTSGPRQREAFAAIDEPELALHRSAVDRVRKGLPDLADYVLVATHSTSFLDADGSEFPNLIHAIRDGEQLILDDAALQVTTTTPRELASHLGVRPSDIAARWRLILLVEGPHDVAVISGFCPGIVDRPDVHLVAMMGTNGLHHLAEAHLLFDLTDAGLLVVTDNGDSKWMVKVCADAETTTPTSREGFFRNRSKKARTPEERAILDLLGHAHRHGSASRFLAPYTFSKHDIANYLPAGAFVAGCTSWEEVDQRFLAQMGKRHFEAGDGGRKKKWINDQAEGAYTEEGLKGIVHSEVERLSAMEGGLVGNRHRDFSLLEGRVTEALGSP